ncbi:hypothetical protein LX73_1455 [Fodinibius salinus]|uniref:Uncharacterized protein n=1 Tax=Fodinibius salinus TaxID=860790 RepID=A0A5D3YJS0_9BACT|nr:hypothetical protein LX73_1455 [Fodinibius salinus]
MTTFLNSYRGASLYEVNEVDLSEGETLGSNLADHDIENF